MAVFDDIKSMLRETLQLGSRADAFEPSTPLFGSVPEFDSMAVVAIVTAIEDQFGVTVEDDEISADVFETVGALSNFVETKLAA